MKKLIPLLLTGALLFAAIACDSGSSASAELEVSETNIDFGETRSGETYTETLTVTNQGDVALDDVQVAVDASGFSVDPFEFELGVGSSVDVTVTFAPEAEGDYSGSITVSSVSENLVATVNLAAFTVDAVVGTWESEGEDVAPGLAAAPFNNVRIEATFNSDNTYSVESEDTEGAVIIFAGTWQATAPNEEGIRGITLEQSEPAALVSSGIFRVDGNRMEYEVIQEGLTGVEPPTVEGGFGSTLVGGNPTGEFWIQRYDRID